MTNSEQGSTAMSLQGKTIPLRFWTRIRNNGDAITSYIVDKVLGGDPVHVGPDTTHLLGTGSIFFMANQKSLLWGCGVLNRSAYLPDLLPSQIRAVRGQLSADFLVQKGVHLPQIPFGDPGILVSKFVKPSANRSRSARIARVPHHDSINHPFFRRAAQRDDVCIVDILNDTLEPIQQIADAEIVLSQSLHGLIYAESFAKPSLWLGDRSDDIWTFKFKDWFSTTYNPQSKPASMEDTVDNLVDRAEQRFSSIDKLELLNAFPYGIRAEIAKPTLRYDLCRSTTALQLFLDPTKTNNLAGSQPEKLSSFFRIALNEAFQGRAERSYSIVATENEPVLPNSDQIALMLTELDKRAHVDFAVIINKPEVVPVGANEVKLSNGLVLYGGFKTRSNIFLLRPDFANITENYVVFAI